MRPKFHIALLALLILGACTSNPVTDRSQLMVISEEQVMAGSYSAYAEMLEDASSRRALNADEKMTARVREIARRIIPHAIAYRPKIGEWRWEANVFKSDVANAFCMPGGKIGVNSSLLVKLKPNDDELAQIIGHEIAHALSEHSREKISTATASTYAVNAIGLTKWMNTVTTTILKNIAEVAVTLPNSRSAELEADQVGVLIAAKGGYDPRAAVFLWEKLRAFQDEQANSLLSTHPLPGERIVALKGEAERLYPVYLGAADLGKLGKLPKFEYR